tara:strand:+ start:86 stop:265 length:180 start_codon:yes stop_codon:yes gene_type:complete
MDIIDTNKSGINEPDNNDIGIRKKINLIILLSILIKILLIVVVFKINKYLVNLINICSI